MVLALATAFAASVDISTSLSTGVFIPMRVVPWLWFAMCLPGATLMSQRNALLITLGAAALVKMDQLHFFMIMPSVIDKGIPVLPDAE